METTMRDLELVEAIVTHGTMTAAAAHLYVSQPALSQRLTSLERRLQSQLFIRTSSGLEPTNDGLLMLTSAKTALTAVRDVEFKIRSQAAGQQKITFLSQCTNNYSWLPGALTTIRDRYPGLVVEVANVDDEQIVAQVVDGELDLAIVTKLRRDMEKLKLQALFDDELVAVAAASHPWAQKERISAEDFADEHLVLFAGYDQAREPTTPLPLPVGATPGKLSTPEITNDMRVQMVSFGDSVTMLPAWVARPYLDDHDIVTRPIGDPPGLTRTWYAATRHGRGDPALDALVEAIRVAATSR